MEHTPAQREAIIGGIDKLTQEIIKLKNNLTEILDYMDLRRKETDEEANQQQNLIESFSEEIKELERILEEKKRNLSESQELQERYLDFTQGLSLMEQSVLDEYQQILSDIGKDISPSLNIDFIAPPYKKKIIDQYLFKEKSSNKGERLEPVLAGEEIKEEEPASVRGEGVLEEGPEEKEEKKLLAMPSVRALAKKLGIEINRINRL